MGFLKRMLKLAAYVIVFSLALVAFIGFISDDKKSVPEVKTNTDIELDKKKREAEERIRQEAEEKRNKEQNEKLRANVEKAIKDKKYYQAYYMFKTSDVKLDENSTKLKEEAIRLRCKEDGKQLKKDVKKIPVHEYSKNIDAYKDLVECYPDNQEYKKKLEAYTKRQQEFLDNLQKKKREEEAAKEAKALLMGKKPIRSSWDGSYTEVERYLKQTAHDPDSIKFENCSEPYVTDDGWGVLCIYRGKNGFGALIRQANWFIILQNRVVDVKDADAYSVK